MTPLEQFGNIDIYLFDQILKNRFHPAMKILDAGCGGGRNLHWFLREGYEVFGVDQNADAIKAIRSVANQLSPRTPSENFQVASVEKLPFPDASFDFVISSAVLHFAVSDNHFNAMVAEMSRVLRPRGVLFARLASDIGIESLVKPLGENRFLLPDGSTRYLVNEKRLIDKTAELNAETLEPIKTTNVQNLRCMTTWVLRKN